MSAMNKGVAAVLGAVLVASALTACSGGSGNWKPTEIEAQTTCKGWVTDKLKSPSSAKFSGIDSTGGPTTWTMTGKVDSQNGFGAMIRSSWTCTAEYRASDGKWHGAVNVLG